jgi:2-keto-4-pentenoate hydratase/2-oxohepta-3-ene-1,7-dioic acid hydratase in catechol pathway
MRLATYRDTTGDHVGVVQGEQIIALDQIAPSMLALIDAGPDALAQVRDYLASGATGVPLSSVKLLAPIPVPRQDVICLGMNYVAHAIESDRARGREPKLPDFPVFFSKAITTVCGPDDGVPLDANVTGQLDYEVELALIFSKRAKNVPAAEAFDYIFGYTIVNDVSARDLQNRHLQFFKGKSLDNTCPIGPWIVTADEIADPTALGLRLRLNGETRQDSTVGDLIFHIPQIIEQLTLGQTIEAGVIVSTGTPSGVGMGRTPPEYMQVGDVMEAEIDQIGVLRNPIVSA